ncbi:hypothetical protein CHU32_13555 [Superficieibacter electus]|uniref:Uncharacterized protein n=1 Tax=Superficieibacter electus TaxID=2022662 RepID=A0A2P5GP37_9ENTR|nr:hypothetical protein [Superficieibacter electus]POP44907.1 hypothetical protein CHU33_10630 [Superficieibacter electus]POP48294.1 hypothetical protein CHU32_13555 [Superficieibacter electus]
MVSMSVKVLIKTLLVLLLLFTGYTVFTEYQYYRDAQITTGVVSNVDYTSSLERRITDTCNHFRGREDCSALYDYDVTWRAQNKDYIYHAEDEREEPAAQVCVNIVSQHPDIGKPCKNIFFNASRLPALITLWGILIFIGLTMLLYRFKQRRTSFSCGAGELYRIYNNSHHLLFETRSQQEAMEFIERGHYRLHSNHKTSVPIGSGHNKALVDCINYTVRSRKGRRKIGPLN